MKQCPDCDFIARSISDLNWHFGRIHSNEQRIKERRQMVDGIESDGRNHRENDFTHIFKQGIQALSRGKERTNQSKRETEITSQEMARAEKKNEPPHHGDRN